MHEPVINKNIQNLFPINISEKYKLLLSDICVNNIEFYKASNEVFIYVSSNTLLPLELIESIENQIREQLKVGYIELIQSFDNAQSSLEEIILNYTERIIKYINGKIAVTKPILAGSCWDVNNNSITVELKKPGADFLRSKNCSSIIENYLYRNFAKQFKVTFLEELIEGSENDFEEHRKNKEDIERALVKDAISVSPADLHTEKPKKDRTGAKSESTSSIIMGKKFEDEAVKISTINLDLERVSIRGKVIKVECKETRTGKFLVLFDVYDYSATITARLYLAKEKYDEIIPNLVIGKWIKLRGNIQYDKFTKEIFVSAHDIVEVKYEMKKDEAEVKRVELHLHTQMSSMDAVNSTADLVARAASWGHKAIAITDHGVVQAFPEAYTAGKQHKIKIIYGTECYLVNEEKVNSKDVHSYHGIILVKNHTGLKNLYKIITESHLNFYYKKPRVPKSLVEKYKEGLIFGSACEAGELYSAILNKKTDEEIKSIIDFYDYLEIQPLGNNAFMVREGIATEEELKKINEKIVELGEQNNKPVVATCDVHFMDPEDEVFRRILMAGQGYADADRQAPLYLRTTEEMLNEFKYLGKEKAYKVVVESTNLIADMVEEIIPIPQKTFPPKIEGAERDVENLSLNKAKLIYGDNLPEVTQKRLEKELNSIIKNGFSVMYMIAQKLVAKSLSDGYLVGSRGSVGSSFVATMTGITEVNPLPAHYICKNCKYSEFPSENKFDIGVDMPDKICPQCGAELKKDGFDIPFETFLGFDCDKEPDIDLNFSGEYQPIAHKYVEELFGEGHVFRAGTIATIADKTAYGFVKNYLADRNINVFNAEVNRLVKGCTGIKRTTGQHPGGVMIVPQDNEIYEFCPVQRPADDEESNIITTHFDYHSIHGTLLKLDILGHDDPTVIRMLEDLTGVDARTIPLDDKETMALFTGTESLGIKPESINSEVGTFAVPEFGTKFVRQMLIDTKPTTFSELVKISGLSHGTDVWLNNAQEIIRQGTAKLSEVICTRDDIMLYLIKKGLEPKTAFKIMEDVRKGKGLKPEYEETMRSNNVPEWYLDSCNKIKYMFPKAHAAAYVMMAFRIAYFKVHYPEAFYAAYFTVRADDFDAELMTHGADKVKEFIKEQESKGNNITAKERNVVTICEVVNEMYQRGIKFLPVDLYKSDAEKFLIEEGAIRPPLNALQGLGTVAAKNIVECRYKQKFLSKDELRITSKVSKAVIEILDRNGCLSGMPDSNQLSLF
ncbi:MAG: PolC-type DNA polymerase III [Deltaproteobacteria bacterium]